MAHLHHPSGISYQIGQGFKEIFFLKLDHLLIQNDDAARKSFKTMQCVDIPIYVLLLWALERFIARPDREYKPTLRKFKKLVFTEKGTPRNGYTPRKALQMLLGYYSGTIPKGWAAEELGFKSATPLRKLTADLLKGAMKKNFPILVRI